MLGIEGSSPFERGDSSDPLLEARWLIGGLLEGLRLLSRVGSAFDSSIGSCSPSRMVAGWMLAFGEDEMGLLSGPVLDSRTTKGMLALLASSSRGA